MSTVFTAGMTDFIIYHEGNVWGCGIVLTLTA